MTGRAVLETSVAVTLRTTPIDQGAILSLRLALSVEVVRARNAETLAIERHDPEGQLVGLERFSALGLTNQSIQGLSSGTRLDRAQGAAQGCIGHSSSDAQQPAHGSAQARAQGLDFGQARGAGNHRADRAAQERR